MTPQDVSDVIDAIVANADKLGLIWKFGPATVVASNVEPPVVTVYTDGDLTKTPIRATSLIGATPAGSRVMVMTVPPNSNYVIGSIAAASTANQLIFDDQVAATVDPLTLTTVAQTTGAIISVEVVGAARYVATGIIDARLTTAGNTAAIGEIAVDGVMPAAPVILYGMSATTDRATVGQQWRGELASGTHTFELFGRKSAAAGVAVIEAPHTNLAVQVYQ